MYAYMTCRPDIGYTVTTLSKFFEKPSAFDFELLKQVVFYLWDAVNWGIRFKCPNSMTLTTKAYEKRFCPTTNYDVPNDCTLTESFKINVNTRKVICFTDDVHGNNLRKWRSTTGLVVTFMGGAIIYKSKT